MAGSLISFDAAIALVADVARPLGTETLGLAEASGRVLAQPVHAGLDAPRCDVSAMDGYAVRDADLDALPATLHVVGSSFAGIPFAGTLGPGQAVRIFTGAYVPTGADRVVIQEVCHAGDGTVTIDQAQGAGRNVREAGSDFAAGALLLPAGTVIGPRQLVVAAAADQATVAVARRPRLAILSTGDELVAPGTARDGTATIPESLSLGLAALAESWGAQAHVLGRWGDSLASLEQAAAEAIVGNDIVVVTGGASVGERDHAKAMFEPSGLDLIFSKVDIKPGKPVWLGRAGDAFIVGLPGNPSSAMVTARLFLAPLLAGLSGRAIAAALDWRPAMLAAPLPAGGARETFMRAQRIGSQASPLAHQDSGAQAPLAQADLLVRCASHAPARTRGDLVDVLDF